MYCQICKPPKQLAMALHTERWIAGKFSVLDVAGQGWGHGPFLWNHTPDSAPQTCQVLCAGNCSHRFSLSAAQQLPPMSASVPASVRRDGRECLMFVLHCPVSSLALAQVLTSARGEWVWNLNQVEINFVLFSFPSGWILNHACYFIQFSKYLHKCCS